MVVETLHTELQLMDIIHTINGLCIDNFGQIDNKSNKISVKEYVENCIYGETLVVGVFRNRQSLNIKIVIDEKDFITKKTRKIYYEFEKPEYHVIGGIVFMEFTKNHSEAIIKEDIDTREEIELISRVKDRKRVFFISKILLGSPIISHNILKDNMIVYKVNNKEIKSIRELREAINSDPDYFILQTTFNTFFIYPKTKLEEIDKSLKLKYKY